MAIATDVDLGSTQAAASSTTIALTTAATTAAGALIVVLVSSGSAVTLNSVGDGTNTYTILGPGNDANGHRIWLAYTYAAASLASSATITATFSGSTAERMIAARSWTGTVTTSIQSGSTITRNNINNETTFTGPVLTTTDADVLMVDGSTTTGAGNPQANTPTGGFTIGEGGDASNGNDEWNFSAGGAQKSACMLYRVVSSTGTYTPGATWDESQAGGSGGHIIAAFKAGASGPTPPYKSVTIS